MVSAPNAACGVRWESITKGSNTIEVASAMAICAVTDSTCGPPRPSDWMIGSAKAADDDAISTAYRAACPVPKASASVTPSPTAAAPTTTARSNAFGIADRSVVSRTGTWVPTTNITNAKPMLASSVNVGSVWSTTPNPFCRR